MVSQYHQSSVDLDLVLALRYTGWAQAANTGYQVNGVDLAARYAIAAYGVPAAAIGYDQADVDIGPTFAVFGSTQVTVATQPGNVAGSAALGVTGTVTSNAATCVAGYQGGPTKTYQWITSNCTATSPNSQSSTFSATVGANSTVNGSAYCVISDGVTSINTNPISVTLTNTYNIVTVGIQPSNVSGIAAAGNPSGTVTSNATTCAGAGGTGSYTYTWHFQTGTGAAFTGPSSATTAVDGVVNAGSNNSGTMYCTISDGTTSANTNVVSWGLTNTTIPQWDFTIVCGELGSPPYEFGYGPTIFGSSVTGGTYEGLDLLGIAEIRANTQGAPVGVFLTVQNFSSNPGQAWFDHFTLNSETFTSAAASYSYNSGVATWTYLGDALGLTFGDSYPGAIIF